MKNYFKMPRSFRDNWIGQLFFGLSILLVSIGSGFALFHSLGVGSSFMNSLIVMAVIVSPLFFIYHELAQKGLLAVLVLTLPLTIDQTLFLRDHIGGAQGWIISLNGLAVLFLYLLLFVKMIGERKTDFKWIPPFSLPFVALIVWAALSLIAAPDRMFGVFELLELIKMYFIFIYIYNHTRTGKNVRWILLFLLIGLGLESIIALLQSVTGSSLNLKIFGGRTQEGIQAIGGETVRRIGGTLGNSNSLAWYLDFVLPISFAMIFFKKKIGLRLLSLICFLGGTVALILTFSRGGWISFFIGTIIVLFIIFRNSSMLNKIYLGIITLLILALMMTLLFGINNPIKERFTSDDNRSAYVRLPLMRVAVNMMKSNPLLGVGLNNYTLVDQFYDQTPERITSQFPYPVHNLFLQLGAETGILGLAFFLLFLCTAYFHNLRFILKSDSFFQMIGTGIFAGITSAMIQGLVENCTIGSYHLLPLWILSGWMFGIAESHPENVKESS